MKRTLNWEDIIVGLILFIIGLVLFISSMNLPSGNELTKGASFLPRIISGLLAILGAIFTTSSLFKKNAVSKSKPVTKSEAIRLLIAFALFFTYILLLKPVGFLIMTALYIMSQSWFITPKEKRQPIKLVIISLSVTGITYLLFVYGLKLLLPAGILG